MACSCPMTCWRRCTIKTPRGSFSASPPSVRTTRSTCLREKVDHHETTQTADACPPRFSHRLGRRPRAHPISSRRESWPRQGQPGANDRLTVGHIGVGGMGTGHLQRHDRNSGPRAKSTSPPCATWTRSRLAKAVKLAGPGVDPYRGLPPHLSPQGHRRRRDRHARPLARRADRARLRVGQARLRGEALLGHHTRRAGHGRRGRANNGARSRSAPRAAPAGAPGTPAGPSATGSSAR